MSYKDEVEKRSAQIGTPDPTHDCATEFESGSAYAGQVARWMVDSEAQLAALRDQLTALNNKVVLQAQTIERLKEQLNDVPTSTPPPTVDVLADVTALVRALKDLR